jgi:thiol:disulfide interchange protein DsbA
MRISALARAITLAGMLATGAYAADQHEEVTRLKNPQPTADPGQVEVIEFFWYGCPHCHKLEPMVEAWQKRLPKNVAFRREHVVWGSGNPVEAHARLFLTLRSLGLIAQHHQAVFEAMHQRKLKLQSEAEIMQWAASRGLDRARFEAAYKSFGTNVQLQRARSRTADYLIESVPSFAVNGKYVTSLGAAHGEQNLFALLDKLVAQEGGR